MNPHHFQEFMQDYAKHFDLLRDINFNTSVKRVTRNMADTTWIVEIEREGKTEMLEFDKKLALNIDVRTFRGPSGPPRT